MSEQLDLADPGPDDPFAEHLNFHLSRGTSPSGTPGKLAPPLSIAWLATTVKLTDQAIRLWLDGRNLPSKKRFATVIDAFFGTNTLYDSARTNMIVAYNRAGRRPRIKENTASSDGPALAILPNNPLPPDGRLASSQPAPDSVAPESQPGKLYGVPPRNPMFKGRLHALESLHQALMTSGRPAAVNQAAVHGLGGIGKTSLATEYAHEHRADYAGVWWAPAETRPVLIASLLELAALLQLPLTPGRSTEALAREVLDRLAESKRPWLLIYDNVTAPRDIRDLVPHAGAHLMITTRWADWTDVAVEVELQVWEPETAVTFLLSRARRSGEEEEAARLAEALGYLPLAVDHAGAYLRHTGVSMASYLERLRELIGKAPPDSRYPTSVYATFNLAIEKAIADSPDAERLLAVLAVLAPERVPHIVNEVILPDPTRRDEAVAALAIVSLVRHDVFADAAPALIMHRLVQAVMQTRLVHRDRLRSALCDAAEALHALFPADVFRRVPLWPTCEKLLPHALTILKAPVWRDAPAAPLAGLGFNAARFLHGRSDLKLAKSIYFGALINGRERLGCGHADVLKAMVGLSNLLRDAGRTKTAAPLARAVINLRQQVHGHQHLDVAEGFSNLAILLRDTGTLEESERMMQEAIRITTELLGERSPQVATLLNNQGNLLLRAGRHAEAEALFRRAIAIGGETLGAGHADVATWTHNLILLLIDGKHWSEAESLLPPVKEVLHNELTATHPNYLRSRVTHAKIHRAAGRFSDAYDEATAALNGYRLAATHPWVVDAAKTLIDAGTDCGRVEDVERVRSAYRLS